ncbi:hypothetical protein Tco_1168618, partial [Tanacetum coccineum]
MTPSFTDLPQNSVRIYANTIIRQDGRVQTTDIAGPSTSKYATTRLPRRSAGLTHLHKAKKGAKKAAFTSAGGKVLLPRFHDTPPPLNHLLSHDQPSTAKFREQIRVYNSMFYFTSFGAKIDHSINTGRAPYTFRINGQNYHRMGSLLPKEGMPELKTTKQYNALTMSEVEAIIINDFEDTHPTRDIVVEQKDTGPQRVSELHPSYIAL